MCRGILEVLSVKLKLLHGTFAGPMAWHPALVTIVADVCLL